MPRTRGGRKSSSSSSRRKSSRRVTRGSAAGTSSSSLQVEELEDINGSSSVDHVSIDGHEEFSAWIDERGDGGDTVDLDEVDERFEVNGSSSGRRDSVICEEDFSSGEIYRPCDVDEEPVIISDHQHGVVTFEESDPLNDPLQEDNNSSSSVQSIEDVVVVDAHNGPLETGSTTVEIMKIPLTLEVSTMSPVPGEEVVEEEDEEEVEEDEEAASLRSEENIDSIEVITLTDESNDVEVEVVDDVEEDEGQLQNACDAYDDDLDDIGLLHDSSMNFISHSSAAAASAATSMDKEEEHDSSGKVTFTITSSLLEVAARNGKLDVGKASESASESVSSDAPSEQLKIHEQYDSSDNSHCMNSEPVLEEAPALIELNSETEDNQCALDSSDSACPVDVTPSIPSPPTENGEEINRRTHSPDPLIKNAESELVTNSTSVTANTSFSEPEVALDADDAVNCDIPDPLAIAEGTMHVEGDETSEPAGSQEISQQENSSEIEGREDTNFSDPLANSLEEREDSNITDPLANSADVNPPLPAIPVEPARPDSPPKDQQDVDLIPPSANSQTTLPSEEGIIQTEIHPAGEPKKKMHRRRSRTKCKLNRNDERDGQPIEEEAEKSETPSVRRKLGRPPRKVRAEIHSSSTDTSSETEAQLLEAREREKYLGNNSDHDDSDSNEIVKPRRRLRIRTRLGLSKYKAQIREKYANVNPRPAKKEVAKSIEENGTANPVRLEKNNSQHNLEDAEGKSLDILTNGDGHCGSSAAAQLSVTDKDDLRDMPTLQVQHESSVSSTDNSFELPPPSSTEELPDIDDVSPLLPPMPPKMVEKPPPAPVEKPAENSVIPPEPSTSTKAPDELSLSASAGVIKLDSIGKPVDKFREAIKRSKNPPGIKRLSYTNEHRKYLYRDGAFVAEREDLGVLGSIYLWRILVKEQQLQKFVPVLIDRRECHMAVNIFVPFKMDEEFYNKYQPVLFDIITDKKDCTVGMYYNIQRCLPVLGYFPASDHLFEPYKYFLKFMTLRALTSHNQMPTETDIRDRIGPAAVAAVEAVESHLAAAIEGIMFRQHWPKDVMYCLLEYPHMNLTRTGLKKGEECEPCRRLGKVGVAAYKLAFHGERYDPDTLAVVEKEPSSWPDYQYCYSCPQSLRALHRLVHFKFWVLHAIRTQLQLFYKRLKPGQKYSAQDLFNYITGDRIWTRKMFYEFQTISGEGLQAKDKTDRHEKTQEKKIILATKEKRPPGRPKSVPSTPQKLREDRIDGHHNNICKTPSPPREISLNNSENSEEQSSSFLPQDPEPEMPTIELCSYASSTPPPLPSSPTPGISYPTEPPALPSMPAPRCYPAKSHPPTLLARCSLSAETSSPTPCSYAPEQSPTACSKPVEAPAAPAPCSFPAEQFPPSPTPCTDQLEPPSEPAPYPDEPPPPPSTPPSPCSYPAQPYPPPPSLPAIPPQEQAQSQEPLVQPDLSLAHGATEPLPE